MAKQENIILYRSKKTEYQLNKGDLWQAYTVIIIGLIPLLIAIFNYFPKWAVIALSSIIFLLSIWVSWYVFVQKYPQN